MADHVASLFEGRAWAMELHALRRFAARTELVIRNEVAAEPRRPSMPAHRGDVGIIGLLGVLDHRPGDMEMKYLGLSSVRSFIVRLGDLARDSRIETIVIDCGLARWLGGRHPRGGRARAPGRSPQARDRGRERDDGERGLLDLLGRHGDHRDAVGPRGLDRCLRPASGLVAVQRQARRQADYVSAGKYKVEGNPDQPLGDEARSHLQELIDASYDLFIGDVALGRHTSRDAVQRGYGQARALHAYAAKDVGLVDRVEPFDWALGRVRMSRDAFAAEHRARRTASLSAFERERAARRRIHAGRTFRASAIANHSR